MNRALPLILLTAAIAAGLVYFATMDDGSTVPADDEGQTTDTASIDAAPPRQPENETRATESSTGPSMATVADERTLTPGAADGRPTKSWEIIPMNDVGQKLDDAKIEARSGNRTKTATGRTKWDAVPSGVWTVSIEAEGYPRWESEVTLHAGKAERTAARLGDRFTVRGELVDTMGEALPRMQVYLLPKGIAHPDRADLASAKRGSNEPVVTSAGVISAMTDPRGKFSFKVPESGEYRISVGPPSDARWTQPKGIELENGGPDHAHVTVPAMAQLTIEFGDDTDTRPTQVSAYRYDGELAARIATQQVERQADRDAARSFEDAQIEAKRRAREEAGEVEADETPTGKGGAGRGGAARGGRDKGLAGDMIEGGSRESGRRQLFEPGWRPLRSMRVDGPEVVLKDMPANEDLRFLFVRGRERITTLAPSRLAAEKSSVGSVALPPLPPPGAVGMAPGNATLTVRVLEDDDDTERPKPSVVWSHGD